MVAIITTYTQALTKQRPDTLESGQRCDATIRPQAQYREGGLEGHTTIQQWGQRSPHVLAGACWGWLPDRARCSHA
ncbi:hypothetical protein SCUP515_05815 [Seiridium cupressi]